MLNRDGSDASNRSLAEAVPKAALALLISTVLYAVGDLLVPGSVELELPYYFAAGLIPAVTLAVYYTGAFPPHLILLYGDMAWTLLATMGLVLAPNATVSGTAFILSIKWLASALLVPWPVALQALSSGVGLVAYFAGLMLSPRVGDLYVHQWALPPVAAALSILGSRILAHSRLHAARHAEVLAQSEHQLQTLVDLSPDGVIVAHDGRVTFANERLALLLGYASPHDLVERLVADVTIARDRDALAAFLTAAVAATEPLPSLMVRLRRSDGSAVPVAVNAAPVLYRGNTSTQITLRDMTATRRNLVLVEGERHVLEQVASGSSLTTQLEAICRLIERLEPDVRASILLVDPEGGRLRHGAAPRLPAAFINAVDGLEIREGNGSCGTAAARRQPVISTNLQEDPDWSNYRDLARDNGIGACWSLPILTSSAELLGTFATYSNTPRSPSDELIRIVERATHLASIVLQRHRLQEDQRDEAEVFSTLATVGRSLISSLDRPILLDRLCQSMRDALHADVSHVFLADPETDTFVVAAGVGDSRETWEAFQAQRFPRRDIPAFVKALHELDLIEISPDTDAHLLPEGLQAAYGIRRGLFVALRRGGEVIGTLTAGYQQRPSGFTPRQRRIAHGIAQLASLALENSRLMEELDGANRVKSAFVATMSHELRTPLNVLIGYQDLLLDEEFGPLTSAQSDIVHRLGVHARQLLVLVTDTLELSRLESGRMQVETQPIHLQPFLERLHKEAEEAWGSRGLELRFRVHGNPAILGDAAKLQVILRSLLANAVKFTERGTISVEARSAYGGVELVVADTGMGIPAEALEAIFEPFTQATPAIATRFGGAGLGLHIVKRLLDLLGGRIAVASTLGEGATFTVWIPETPPYEHRA